MWTSPGRPARSSRPKESRAWLASRRWAAGWRWPRNAGWVTASLAMDDLIAGTGVSYRALTMPSFMDNILRQVEAIKSRGMFSAVVDTAGLLKRRCLI
jgi:hypothetical protein